jgi:hypothetical protein
MLMITAEVQAKISAAIAEARKTPVPLNVIMALAMPDKDKLMLSDRPPGFVRPQSQHIEIPIGYRAAITFEEQPAGLVRHLSVSVDAKPGDCPSVPAIQMIASAFGIEWSPDSGGARVWLEEFESGYYAVNLVAVVDSDQPAMTSQ